MGREESERGRKDRDRLANSALPPLRGRAVSNPEPDEHPLWELLGSKKHVKVSMEAVYEVNPPEKQMPLRVGADRISHRTKGQAIALIVLLFLFVIALSVDEVRLLRAVIVAETLWNLIVLNVRKGISAR